MSDSLPASFYRAEAQWLNPPEYPASPSDIKNLCRKAESLIEEYAENVGEIEDSDGLSYAVDELEKLKSILIDIKIEVEELEAEIPGESDPERIWDERGDDL